MIPTVFVGDLHGKLDIYRRIIAQYPPEKNQLIFVGDYMDSFTECPAHQIHLICDVKKLVAKNYQTHSCFALVGNHDVQYWRKAAPQCTGSSIPCRTFASNHPYHLVGFTYAVEVGIPGERALVSHAGLSNKIWRDTKGSQIDTISAWLKNEDKSPIHWVGKKRGGKSFCGGILWCDYDEFEPIPGLTQIFGHSSAQLLREKAKEQVTHKDGSQTFCIDVLDYRNSVLVNYWDKTGYKFEDIK